MLGDRVRDSGRGAFVAPPLRPTLLFLHGFMGGAEDWEPIMLSMAHAARCIAVDLPGHGGSLSGECCVCHVERNLAVTCSDLGAQVRMQVSG